MKLTLANGRLIDPKNGVDSITNLHLADGKVAAIGAAPAGFVAEETLDVSGKIVCPGLIDLSARVNALESELQAAVAGGVTTLVCPPDANPVLDEPELAERLVRRAADADLARVLPLGALTLGLKGERLAELAGLAAAGCVAFSQGNEPVVDTQALLRALEYAATFDFPVWMQPQEAYLSKDGVAHDGEVASRLGLAGIPVSAETIAIHTLLELARQTGVRLHLTRLSSAAGVKLVADAKAAGQAVSCDIGVHHLHLSEHDIGFFDTAARFMPPLRSAADRTALRQAVAQGVAALCSDHTPVKADDKLLPFGEAKPGATGLELLLPLTLKWASEDKQSLNTAIARLTCDPASVLGVDAGHLAVGSRADVCVFDPAMGWQVTPEALRSKGKNSPYRGYELDGKVTATLVAGKLVYRA
jgi:dihydroorotase